MNINTRCLLGAIAAVWAVSALPLSATTIDLDLTTTNPGPVTLGAGDNMFSFGGFTVDYLIVAGGGGGGGSVNNDSTPGGGGGAGGLLQGTTTLTGAQTIVVGNGGAGGAGGFTSTVRAGTKGQDSVAFGFTAEGGGSGGDYDSDGGNGGSGGGAGARTGNATGGAAGQANQGPPVQGFNGGSRGSISGNFGGAGGGGAGGAGANFTNNSSGRSGGAAVTSDITGADVQYAGGGGGGSASTTAGTGGASATGGTGGVRGNNGSNALDNTGGGGGGAGAFQRAGGSGGSGIVVVRYTGPQVLAGGSVSTVGGDTVHQFLTTGSSTLDLYSATVAGDISGVGNLIWNKTGTLTLSGTNTYAGTTTITAGTLEMADSGVLGNGSYAANVALTGGTLRFNTTANQTLGGVISGAGQLAKANTGTLTLAGANTFTGPLSVAAGTLAVPTINNASANGPLGNSASAVVLGSAGAAGTLSYTGGTASTTKPFTAAAGGTAAFSVTEAATVLTLSGAIDGDGDKSFGGAGSTVVSGAISGGNVIKTGAGTLTLETPNGQANTTVNAGQLNINQFAALGIASGTLTMAGGTSLDNTSAAAVTISNSKNIALGNSLTFVGTNDLDLGEGTTTLSTTTTFTVSAGTLTLSGDVVGTGFGIVKEGVGTLRLDGLTGSGSFTGNSTINAGTLLLDGSSQLGGGPSTVVTLGENGFLQVGPSASLNNVTIAGFTGNVISASVINANQDFTQNTTLTSANQNYNGVQTIGSGVTVTAPANYLGTIPGSATAGRIVFESGATLAATAAFSVNPKQGVSLAAGTATVSVVGGQAVFFESDVAGSGGLRKTGAGNLRLTGTNTYQGGTVVDQGILGISSGAALGDVSGGLTIDGAIVAAATNPDGSGTGATIDAGRTVLIGNGKTSGLHAQNGLTLRYDGAISEIDSQGMPGALQFGLTGPRQGTVILGGANTYRGDTTLSAGTLKLGSGGSFANSPRIIVGDAAGSAAAVFDLTEKTAFSIGATQTLMGKGRVLLGPSTALTINGLLSPGNSPGILTYDGGGTVNLAGTTLMEITGLLRGTEYDAIDVLGGTTLSLGGTLQLDFSQLFDDDTVFNLFTPSGGSSLAGTFSAISLVGIAYGDLTFTQEGESGVWKTNVGQDDQSMTFTSSTGTLSIIAVPEPDTLILGGLGLAAGVGWHLRRRKA